jgi:tetratricopeptide (TPR) repeat protein
MKGFRDAWRSALLLSCLAGAATTSLSAQATVGRISGTVRDEAGKPVSGATITATNPEQAITLTATSDPKGRFGMLGMRRGIWVFAAAAPGYQKTSQAGEVNLGSQNPPVNIKLVKSPSPQPGPLASLPAADVQSQIDAAEAAVTAGDLTSAIATYRDLLSKVPALTTGYLRVGALLEQKGDPAGALETYRELVRLEPDNARATAAIARLTRVP